MSCQLSPAGLTLSKISSFKAQQFFEPSTRAAWLSLIDIPLDLTTILLVSLGKHMGDPLSADSIYDLYKMCDLMQAHSYVEDMDNEYMSRRYMKEVNT